MKISSAVSALWDAMQAGVHMPPEWAGKLTLEQGYAVQLGLMARHIANGELHSGWKVGLTAKAMRDQQGIHKPCFGYLLRSGHVEIGHCFDRSTLTAPAFENELCLTIGKALRGPGISLGDVLGSISHAAPALEIVEVRGPFAGNLALTMADNAQHKAYVTGNPVPLTPDNTDLARCTVDLAINGELCESASGAAVMGVGGMMSVVWLANKLAEFDLALEAGMHVMSGSFTKQYAVRTACRVQSKFLPFGPVSASFS